MAKYTACICEGAAERAIIDLLLDKKKLIFEREDLIEVSIPDDSEPSFRKHRFFRKYPFSAFKHCHAYSIIIVVFLQEIIR